MLLRFPFHKFNTCAHVKNEQLFLFRDMLMCVLFFFSVQRKGKSHHHSLLLLLVVVVLLFFVTFGSKVYWTRRDFCTSLLKTKTDSYSPVLSEEQLEVAASHFWICYLTPLTLAAIPACSLSKLSTNVGL